MKDTKKEIKDRIIEVLDKHARTDEEKLSDRLCGLGRSFKTEFVYIEKRRSEKQAAEAELEKYYATDASNRTLEEGDKLREEVRIKTMVYLSYLEGLYKYLIGEKKLGDKE